MYSKTHVRGKFFKDTHNENTEKVTYGRFSESVSTGKTGEDGKAAYEYETYRARFVGKAREKALALEDKARITLTEWAIRNPYNKEKEREYPYLMVMDFEVREKSGGTDDEAPVEEGAEQAQ